MLADIAQKLVAKAVDGVLSEVEMGSVHTVQTGFVGRPSILGSVLRIEGAVEEFLFETRVPSLSHGWLWESL